MTEYRVIQQAIIGTGFDYWLGLKEDSKDFDPNNFLNGRLEISGMGSGSESERNYRVRQKLQQTDKSDFLKIPAYLVVTEFSNPVSIFIKKR